MRFILLFLLGFCMISSSAFGQSDLKILVIDSISHKPINRVTVTIIGTDIKGTTNATGLVELSNIPDGKQQVFITHGRFWQKLLVVEFPISVEIYGITLAPFPADLKSFPIEITRSNCPQRYLPTNVDVLIKEIEPSASRFSSTIGHLLNLSTGTRIQTTTTSSGGSQIRLQGLDGRYTQLLKDGFPLFGGLSSSFDLSQIQPLAFRQIEIIKGAASSFYGGGGAGGVINLVSKRPSHNQILLHQNLSNIGARDFNALILKRFGKLERFGFTGLATLYMHTPYDADKDGYSDLPSVLKIHFSPKFFFFPTENTEISLGAIITDENRRGGDLDLINGFNADTNNFYFDTHVTRRLASQLMGSHTFGEYHTISLKNSINSYERKSQVRQNQQGDIDAFGGNQFRTYSELNYQLIKGGHNLNVGFNINSDEFSEEVKDTSFVRDHESIIYGGSLNYIWNINKFIIIEAGLRADQAMIQSNSSNNSGEFFILPRLSTLFKLGKQVSLRLGGGTGYQMPTIFRRESELFAYQQIAAIDFGNVVAERSYSGNFDVEYQSNFSTDLVSLRFDQNFFYNLIDKPIQLTVDSLGLINYQNSSGQLTTAGFESQIEFTVWKFTLKGGYTYTDAYIQDGAVKNYSTLTPKHSFKGRLTFAQKDYLTIGVHMDYNSEQQIASGLRKRSYATVGVIAEGSIGSFSLFINFENITDVRQTRYESMLSGPNNTPLQTEVWAPLNGFSFNSGIKVRF
ncbi:MAG: TonB-dependent receptor plug domain-containing protein [Crocinitomicaceae bacterium]|nr:TonB-dependent receptor plug domain-containing protein [Crocinitomicaceae bacterium]